jgi:hypothetical protein
VTHSQASPKASPKKKPTPKGSPAGGVTKPKVARSGTMTRTAKDAERFLKKTKFEDKTTPMALRGGKTKMGDVESINKNVCLSRILILTAILAYGLDQGRFKEKTSNGFGTYCLGGIRFRP